MRPELQVGNHRASGLVDVLDRVLDKGLAIAGDIKISLAEVELLTIRIRLIVCSIDKAQEIGLDWWKHDPHFSPGKSATPVTDELRQQIVALEEKIALLSSDGRRPAARRAPRAKRK
jgi:gas vesicle protein GvpA/GvpJ/GvpM family